MSLDSTHPLYDAHVNAWSAYRDFYEGEVCVKKRSIAYLPPTRSMVLDGMGAEDIGKKIYDGYLARAVFPEHYFEAVENNLGRLFFKEPAFELPPTLEYLRTSATRSGETLLQVLRHIYKQQLAVGRLGIYIDVIQEEGGGAKFVFEFYRAEAIKNWDNGDGLTEITFVALDESGYKLDQENLTWSPEKRTRILKIVDGKFRTYLFTDGADYIYSKERLDPPMYFGKPLNKVPFIFVNATTITPEPEKSPLSGLASVVWSIYKGEADYRQNLSEQGQDTLVIIGSRAQSVDGAEDAVRTGAGSYIGVDQGGDAKYIGVTSDGLPEQRMCLESDYKRADLQAGKLTNTGHDRESGQGLSVRVNSQTISLDQIARAGAEALQKALKLCAEWSGANPEQCVVTPNVEFVEIPLGGKDILDLVNARRLGAPLSYESIHAIQVERGLTKLPFEAELDKIKEENVKLDMDTGNGDNKETKLGE